MGRRAVRQHLGGGDAAARGLLLLPGLHRAMTVAGAGTLRAPNRKIAAALTVVPGLGQLYNRQPGKAVSFFVGTLITLGPAVALIMAGERIGHSLLANHPGALVFVV